MLKTTFAAAVIGLALALSAGPGQAQQKPAISLEQATKIARDAGLVTIREIELDDGKWEVEGSTQAGEERELHIDAASGKVTRDERD